MRGVALQGRRQRKAPRPRNAGKGRDRPQAEPPLGEGAGLVGEAVGGEREPLDRVRAGGDEPGAGEGPEGRGHRGRGGEREGAGAGHHQDRDQHRDHPDRIVEQPSDRDPGREHEDAGDEPRRGPIREHRDRRPFPRRLPGPPEHPAEHRLVSGAPHLDLDHPGAVDAAREHRLAGRARRRIRFPGEQRFVERGVPGADHAVGGNHLAGADPHPVAGTERRGRHPFGPFGPFSPFGHRAGTLAPAPTSGHAGRHQRSGAGEGADRRGGPPAGEQLQVAGAVEQGDEHHHRVEPDLALAGERREDASEEGNREAQRHRYVHGQPPAAKRRRGAGEEGPSRPDQHRNREHHRQPPEELLETGVHAAVVVARVERDAQQHHLHPEHRRDAEPPDAGASLGLDARLLRVHGIGGGAVSGPGQCFEQDVQARGARVEPHLGSP